MNLPQSKPPTAPPAGEERAPAPQDPARVPPATAAPPAAAGAAAPSSLAERLRDWLRDLLGRPADESLREGLEDLLEEHEESATPTQAEERLLLRNILNVSELQVADVMVPRADIVAVEEKASLDQVVRLFTSAGHSRLPVYRDRLDDVIGMAHIKDLMRFWGPPRKFELSQLVRRVLIVPPSMRLLDLLLEMRAKRVHMALVVDEYGGVDGLATIEDAVEQIVGDIHDEHRDATAPHVIERPDGTLEADGRCAVEDLEERLRVRLIDPEREEYVDTLGGLLFSLTRRIPQRGELVNHPTGLAFEVIDADPRRVKRVRIRNLPAARVQPAP